MTETREILLCFADQGSETVSVTFLGANRYKLEETPIWNDDDDMPVYLGDVVELETQADGTHRFIRIVEQAPLRHYNWFVPEFFVDSPHYLEFGNAVIKAGGACERVMGGWLFVHVPITSSFEADQELDRYILAAKRVAQRWWWPFRK